MAMTKIKPLTLGVHWVSVVCPGCGVTEHVPLTLTAKLVRTDEDSKLGVGASSKARDHTCGQTAITVVAETGEILQLGGEQ
jgi:hypothetical protein